MLLGGALTGQNGKLNSPEKAGALLEMDVDTIIVESDVIR